MRSRVPTVLLALTGLLVAIAVGLVANAIASRSFTPGVDALPSAGSLAPPSVRPSPVPAQGAKPAADAHAAKPVTAPKAATTSSTTTPPKPVTSATPATTTTPATVPAPVTTDDHGGKGSGKGSGDSSGHGKHGSDD
jgi:hypothetical protein